MFGFTGRLVAHSPLLAPRLQFFTPDHLIGASSACALALRRDELVVRQFA
jgi:hypothetical protein